MPESILPISLKLLIAVCCLLCALGAYSESRPQQSLTQQNPTQQNTARQDLDQFKGVTLAVKSRIHFNANVSDFEKTRSFFEKLGFATLSGFPDTNTLAMAQAIGIQTPTAYDGAQGGAAGGYLLHGELIALGFNKGVIDLIEFTIPRNEAPPYSAMNRLGLSRAVIYTRDLNWDYQNMQRSGIRFVAPPVSTRDGLRFAVFLDPDGIFYELREQAGAVDPDAPSQFEALGAVVINVSDFERSLAWYQMLGFELSHRLPQHPSADVSRGLGFDTPIEVIAGALRHKEDGSELELVEWRKPRDLTPPYPPPINHIGIHRMAFATTDIEGDVAKLRARGVEFVSDITPCCSGDDAWGSIVAFYDPDGIVMELADQPMMNVMNWLMNLFR